MGTFFKRYDISEKNITQLKAFYLNYIAYNPDCSLKDFIDKIFDVETLLALDIAAPNLALIVNGYLNIIGKVFDAALLALAKRDREKLTAITDFVDRDADIIGFSNATVHAFLDKLPADNKTFLAKDTNTQRLVSYIHSNHARLPMRGRYALTTFAICLAKDVTDDLRGRIHRTHSNDTIDLNRELSASPIENSAVIEDYTAEDSDSTSLRPLERSDTVNLSMDNSYDPKNYDTQNFFTVRNIDHDPVRSPSLTINPLADSAYSSHASQASEAPLENESRRSIARLISRTHSNEATAEAPVVNPKTGNCCFGFFSIRSNKVAPGPATSINYSA